MSRQPSPGPAAASQPTSYYRDAHGIPIEKPHLKIVYRGGDQQAAQAQSQQGAPAPGTVATSSTIGRSKSRAYQSGIAAGAEDVKYAAKYRDLKHKVKEIESDNDRLMFKVLQAKRNIQRAKLERAILYERLGALPASPPQGNAPLPPQHVVQQHIPPGGQIPRHSDPQAYRHHRASGPPAEHHHHRQHHPIQPAPPSHISPPLHHSQAHHPHQPQRDEAHPGQLPITHVQQACTIPTPDGPLLVVAGPDGRPVMTADGQVIPVQDIHAPPSVSASANQRKRSGRVSKEVRETREREARDMRERERDDVERKREQVHLAGANSGRAPSGQLQLEPTHSSGSRSHSTQMRNMSPPLPPQVPGAPQVMSMSSRKQREWEIESESRERERMQRREDERHEYHHARGHSHRYHQQVTERAGSPHGVGSTYSPVHASSPQAHRSHSQASHASYRSHHSHSHHIHSHSHSHSASPRSPGGTSYPSTRIHNHQRVGPGSYVLRDRGDVPPAEHAPTPVPATPAQNEDEDEPPTAGPSSRVPTPPYMQRPVRAEFNNHSPPAGEDAVSNSGAKNDAHPSEEGSGAHSTSTTTPS